MKCHKIFKQSSFFEIINIPEKCLEKCTFQKLETYLKKFRIKKCFSVIFYHNFYDQLPLTTRCSNFRKSEYRKDFPFKWFDYSHLKIIHVNVTYDLVIKLLQLYQSVE